MKNLGCVNSMIGGAALAVIVLLAPVDARAQEVITVDPPVTYQTMRGWEVTGFVSSPCDPLRDAMIELAVDDIGIDRVRLEVRSGVENSIDYYAAWVANYGRKYTSAGEYDIDLPDVTLGEAESLSAAIPQAGVITVYALSDCPTDLNDDAAVDAADLAVLLGAWGPNAGHAADLNGDGAVNAADLAILLGTWGSC